MVPAGGKNSLKIMKIFGHNKARVKPPAPFPRARFAAG
jgi:hypothetical protein